MFQFSSPQQMNAWAAQARADGERIVLVPTMGALHAGHLSLVERAKSAGSRVVASIFVNPAQFAPNEDLATYPRTMVRDLELLEQQRVDAVFTPSEGEMYRAGFDTWVAPDNLARELCGRSRPNHFRGVCTVVHVLFNITRCHAAVFGAKDFQQLQIIRRMVCDLWLDVEIIAGPIVRETDGLAMSSRNAKLSPNERHMAVALHRALYLVARAHRAGQRNAAELTGLATAHLQAAGVRVDYVSLVDPETLQLVDTASSGTVCAIAGYIGATRLIDNRQL